MAAKDAAQNKDEFVPDQMTAQEIARAMGGEIVKSTAVYTDDEVRAIASWSDIQALMDSKDYESVLVDEVLGDGFTIMSRDDKHKLIGVPMHVLDWTFHNGDMGEFVSARIVIKTGEKDEDIQKWRIADGSTGVFKDLRTLSAKLGRTHSVTVRRGFRVSQYDVEIDTPQGKKMIPAETFYLDLGK